MYESKGEVYPNLNFSTQPQTLPITQTVQTVQTDRNTKIHPYITDQIIKMLVCNGGRFLDPLISNLQLDSYMLNGGAKTYEFGYYTI